MIFSISPCVRGLSQVAVCMTALLATHQAATASDPLVYKAGNTLVIEGDGNPNSVSLVGSKDEYSTIGVYINDVPWVFENVQNILADLGGGDDLIAMDRIRIYGNVDVIADSGNNTVYLGGWGYGQSDIGGHVAFTTGGGNDSVFIADCLVDNDVDVLTGAGNNLVELGYAVGPGIDPGANTFSNDLTILTGDNQDVIRVMRTVVWGQGLIETFGDDDDVRLGPVQIAMIKSDVRVEGPNDLKSNDPAPDRGDDRSTSDLDLKTRESNGVPATNAFSDLTINAGTGHDFVGLETTMVSGTALIQMWNGNDDLYLFADNYFYGNLTAQGGIGTDYLFDSPTNFYSNAPTFMGFE